MTMLSAPNLGRIGPADAHCWPKIEYPAKCAEERSATRSSRDFGKTGNGCLPLVAGGRQAAGYPADYPRWPSSMSFGLQY